MTLMSNDLQVVLGKDHLSYSALTDYLSCGEKFRLVRVEHVPRSPAVWFAGGSAFHTATETYDEATLVEGIHPDDAKTAALDTFRSEFERLLGEEEPGVEWRAAGRTKAHPLGEDAAWWANAGRFLVERYITWSRALAPSTSLWTVDQTHGDGSQYTLHGIEVPFAVDFDGVKVVGRIDRVFVDNAGNFVVVDLKTGKRVPDPTQLGVYAAAMEVQYGQRPRYGSYYMARDGRSSNSVLLDQYTPDMVGRWFRDAAKGIGAGIFIPHQSSFCNACEVRDYCYAVTPTAPRPDFRSDL